jgi:DNA-binding transcriptional ArsR family regulator
MNGNTQTAYDLVQDATVAATLLNPIRIKILGLLKEPDSASGLARKMDMNRQQLNYHLKELEKNKLVELVEEKKKGNCIERIVRASARSYLICMETSAEEPAALIKDKFSSTYQVAAAAAIIRDVAALREAAAREKKKLSTFTLQTAVNFSDPSALHDFTEELSQSIARLVAKYHSSAPEARSYTFNLFAHPALHHP